MIKSNRNRRSSNGRASRTLREIRKLESALKWETFTPSLTIPTINRTFTFPMKVVLETPFTQVNDGSNAVTSKLYRVEDVIEVVRETLSMSTDWNDNTFVRIQKIRAYGYVNSTSETNPIVTFQMWDPENGVCNKAVARYATIDNPARMGIKYPTAISGHYYSWDGTEGTSAELVGIKSNTPCNGVVEFEIVVTFSREFASSSRRETPDQLPPSINIDDSDESANSEPFTVVNPDSTRKRAVRPPKTRGVAVARSV
jgi:hypothetical protein